MKILLRKVFFLFLKILILLATKMNQLMIEKTISKKIKFQICDKIKCLLALNSFVK